MNQKEQERAAEWQRHIAARETSNQSIRESCRHCGEGTEPRLGIAAGVELQLAELAEGHDDLAVRGRSVRGGRVSADEGDVLVFGDPGLQF